MSDGVAMLYAGLSTATKPTIGMVADAQFIEIDTGDVYTFNGTDWSFSYHIGGGGGGIGDMLKSVYDPDADGVIDLAQLDPEVISMAELIIALASKSDVGHGHTEADVTGLVTDLAGKAPVSHSHPESEVTNLVTDLAGKAPVSHGHPESEVTGLVADLAAKETPAGAQAKVDAHKDLATGVHGAGVSTIETIAGSAAKVSAHDELTSPHSAATSLEKIAHKGQVSGYAGLDAGGKVPAAQLPFTGVGDFALLRYRKSGRYHSAFPDSNGTLALTVNRLYAIPFMVVVAVTVTRIAIHVTTMGTLANCRLGIYQDDGTTYPGALVSDCGVVSMSSINGIKEITGLSIPLAANTLYWFVCVCDVAATIAAFAVVYLNAFLGYPTTALNTVGFNSYYVNFTYAVLPASFPVGAAPTNVASPKIAVYF